MTGTATGAARSAWRPELAAVIGTDSRRRRGLRGVAAFLAAFLAAFFFAFTFFAAGFLRDARS